MRIIYFLRVRNFRRILSVRFSWNVSLIEVNGLFQREGERSRHDHEFSAYGWIGLSWCSNSQELIPPESWPLRMLNPFTFCSSTGCVNLNPVHYSTHCFDKYSKSSHIFKAWQDKYHLVADFKATKKKHEQIDGNLWIATNYCNNNKDRCVIVWLAGVTDSEFKTFNNSLACNIYLIIIMIHSELFAERKNDFFCSSRCQFESPVHLERADNDAIRTI